MMTLRCYAYARLVACSLSAVYVAVSHGTNKFSLFIWSCLSRLSLTSFTANRREKSMIEQMICVWLAGIFNAPFLGPEDSCF